MSTREIGVMIFYSLLTWFLMPMLVQRVNGHSDCSKQIGFIIGFIVSIALYNIYGKHFIDN